MTGGEGAVRGGALAGVGLAVLGGELAAGALSVQVARQLTAGTMCAALVVGLLLAASGLLVLGRGGAVQHAWQRAAARLLGGAVAFAVLAGGVPWIGVPAMGLVLAVYALTFIAAQAVPTLRTRDVVLLATALALASYVTAIAFRLPVRLWPTFIPDW